MKKIILLFLAISTQAFCQSFDRGTILINAGAGLSGFTTILTDKDTKFEDKDGAAASMFPFSAEFGITNWLGGGVEIVVGSYFLDDSSDIESSGFKDFGALAAIHLINRERFNLAVEGVFGGSSLKGQFKDSGGSYKSFGLETRVAANFRIFFGDHFALFLRGGPAWNNYNQLTLRDQNNNTYDFKFQMSGGFGAAGITIKI